MRVGILERDTQSLILYSNEYYSDVKTARSYLKCQIDNLSSKMGLTTKTLVEYISKKQPLFNGMELYKLTYDDELERLL